QARGRLLSAEAILGGAQGAERLARLQRVPEVPGRLDRTAGHRLRGRLRLDCGRAHQRGPEGRKNKKTSTARLGSGGLTVGCGRRSLTGRVDDDRACLLGGRCYSPHDARLYAVAIGGSCNLLKGN